MNALAASPYERQLSDFRLTYSKAGSITSITLVLAGVALDHFSYPDHSGQFLIMRLVVGALTAIIFGILYTDFGREHVRALTMVWLLMPQIMIAQMIYLTNGAESIYFVGLHLAMYAVGIILPINLLEGVGFGVVTLVLYVLACVLYPGGVDDGAKLYTNTLGGVKHQVQHRFIELRNWVD